jgi:hypothetical protein
MGVFSERLFAVFLVALPWRRTAEQGAGDHQEPGSAGHDRSPVPTWQTWEMHSPTTSTMRADLEALRTYTRVR